MKLSIPYKATGVQVVVVIRGTDGLPKTGLSGTSAALGGWLREGDSSSTQVTLNFGAGTVGTWVAAGYLKEVNSTYMKGVYTLDLPDNLWDGFHTWSAFQIHDNGTTSGIVDCPIEMFRVDRQLGSSPKWDLRGAQALV